MRGLYTGLLLLATVLATWQLTNAQVSFSILHTGYDKRERVLLLHQSRNSHSEASLLASISIVNDACDHLQPNFALVLTFSSFALWETCFKVTLVPTTFLSNLTRRVALRHTTWTLLQRLTSIKLALEVGIRVLRSLTNFVLK